MIRATITLLLASLFVLIVGSPLLVLAYIHPYPPAADWASRVWSRLILLAAGVRLTVDGAEHVAGPSPKYFVGNHQSAMDIPILITALAGRVRFMAKDNLFRIPLFGGLLTLYDYVPVDRARARRALTSMETMIERVRRHSRSLVVFPEGTRSVDGRLLPFRKGAIRICQRAGLDVVPFAISGSSAIHSRGVFRLHPGTARIRFNEPIPACDVAAMSSAELHNRIREAVEQGLIEPWPDAAGRGAAPMMPTEPS